MTETFKAFIEVQPPRTEFAIHDFIHYSVNLKEVFPFSDPPWVWTYRIFRIVFITKKEWRVEARAGL